MDNKEMYENCFELTDEMIGSGDYALGGSFYVHYNGDYYEFRGIVASLAWYQEVDGEKQVFVPYDNFISRGE